VSTSAVTSGQLCGDARAAQTGPTQCACCPNGTSCAADHTLPQGTSSQCRDNLKGEGWPVELSSQETQQHHQFANACLAGCLEPTPMREPPSSSTQAAGVLLPLRCGEWPSSSSVGADSSQRMPHPLAETTKCCGVLVHTINCCEVCTKPCLPQQKGQVVKMKLQWMTLKRVRQESLTSTH